MAEKRGASHQTSKATELPELPLALCRGMPLELFIGKDFDGPGRPSFNPEPAKRVCRRCPEREPCLDYALDNPSLTGVWGATTQADRVVIRADRDGV